MEEEKREDNKVPEHQEPQQEHHHEHSHEQKPHESHEENKIEHHHEHSHEQKPHESHEENKIEHHHEHQSHDVHHEHKASSSPFKLNLGTLLLVLTVILGIVIVINIAMSFDLFKDLTKNSETGGVLNPAEIGLVTIGNSRCTDCFDISPVISSIKSSNVNIKSEKTLQFDSPEAKQLISKYGIQKIPTVVVTGEIGNSAIQGLTKKGDALILEQVGAPYTNATNGQVEGRVTVYSLVDPSCNKCGDMEEFISQIEGIGVNIAEKKSVDINGDEGKALVAKYKIGFAPTVILSKDAGAYDLIEQSWSQVGTKETDGSYILRTPLPPFINITTSRLEGLVKATYLTDTSCSKCYNVSLHRDIVTSPLSFNIKLESEEFVDVNDLKGKELISRYNITQVPTVILSPEVKVYPTSEGLRQFFTVKRDGAYVFTSLELMGTYKNLATNEIVRQQNPAQGST